MLVGEVVANERKSRSKAAAGLYPLGTAFAVRTTSLNHILSAYHTITANSDCSNWYVTPQVDRCSDGQWIFSGALNKVTIHSFDEPHDIVAFTVQESFASQDAIEICPSTEITKVADECLFKTYYCPVDDIESDPSYPSLAPSPSEYKKMYAIKNSENGHMWLRGGLCGGSSGGVVVNQQGRAVGMHVESFNSCLTVKNVKEADSRDGKRARDEISVHSDAISSIANSHGSSQVVVLLSQNLLVRGLCNAQGTIS